MMNKERRFDEVLDRIGLIKGDIIDLSSDLIAMALEYRKLKENFDPNVIIDFLQERIAEEGTICIRTWNWGFCHGKTFDYRNTPSEVGALGDVALKRKDFRRTKHPIYSFAVWGKHQNVLCEMDNKSAWGSDSPFAFFTENGGKQLMLSSTMWNSLTYVHYVEEQVGVKYRFPKDFTAPYIDENGIESIKTYSMNVRNLDLDINMNSEKFADDFYEKGILKTGFLNKTSISTVMLKGAYEIIKEDILNNRSRKICTYIGQEDY